MTVASVSRNRRETKSFRETNTHGRRLKKTAPKNISGRPKGNSSV
jgi:hypothetical protein